MSPPGRPPARAWAVYAAAVTAYIVAVLQRTSLGVAGVDAAERYDVVAATLSTLAVAQLVVYAGLQIPVGVLLDRIGPKPLILAGAVVMATGQTVVAVSGDFGGALLGRVLVGAGDAATFISVIRLLPSWFSGPLLPQVSQWTGTLGQLGQVLSALPFSALLHGVGWSPAFGSLAGLSALVVVLVAVVVASGEPPPSTDALRTVPASSLLARLLESLRRPGTQLGFWSHFTTQSPGTMLTMLWGFPFLSVALGYGPGLASGLLALIVVGGVATGPVLGLLSARYPLRRSNLVLAIVGAVAAALGALILWPGRPPLALVVVVLLVVGVGGPGSLIGFDFARTFNPRHSLGSANGVVNVGGFTAAFVMTFLVGVVLDALTPGGSATVLDDPDRFRTAFAVVYPVLAAGVVMILVTRRRTRRRMEESEGITVAPLWVVLGTRWSRRRT